MYKSEEADYLDGKLNGVRTFWYTDGDKIQEEEYLHGVLNGTVTYWYGNGNKLEEINYLNGKLNATKIEKSEYLNGELSGTKTTWRQDGTRLEKADYINGKLDGAIKSWNSNNQMIKDGVIKKDKFSGLKTKYKDGKKYLDINYKNDIRDGAEIKYYATGQVNLETTYKNGKPQGSVLSWDENGNQR